MAYFRCGGGVPSSVKTLPTYKTASGSVATFETDMTENLVSVKCQIVAKQASGTPSPVNPLPITTYTGMNVVQMSDITNKTFFDGLLLGTHDFYKFTGLESWTFNSANQFFYTTLSLYSANYVKNSSYPIENDGITSFLINPNIIRVYLDANPSITSDTDMNTVFTSDSYMIYELETPKTPTITKTQFETLLTAFGIDGSLYNIPFGQTVANGVLDVTTGKLTITHKLLQLDSLTWTYDSQYNRFISSAVSDSDTQYIARTMPFLCSNYQVISDGRPLANVPDKAIYYGGGTRVFVIHDSAYDSSTQTAFENSLVGQTLCYPLYVNYIQTKQLNSKQITASLNENNIWCDTGDTTAKYILSVGEALRQG